jgi:heptosyltransferase-2
MNEKVTAAEPPAVRPSPPLQRVLVREVNWVGDLVLSLPALKALRRAFPDAHLAVLARPELLGFFDGMAWVDERIAHPARRGLRGLKERCGLARALRAKNYDLAVLFPNSFESAFWVWRAGIPRRAGYARDCRGWMLTHRATPTREVLETHQVHYYLHMLRETLGVEGEAGEFALEVHASHRDKMRAWLAERREHPAGPLLALAVAAAYGPAKEWPAERFAALIDRLGERHGAECVLLGSPSERLKCEQVAAMSERGALLAAGVTGLGEALALLSLCQGFAGNDSGAMHLAGALGLPTVGIFGSTRADRTGPLGPKTKVIYHQIECSPCLARVCRYGHYECLKQITPEEVEGALAELRAFG